LTFGSARSAALAACVLAASCQDSPSAPQVRADIYGHPGPLKGKALWGIEDVAILLCEGPRSDCELPRNQAELRDCALTFSDAGSEALQRLDFERDETGAPMGEVWIEGTGRKTRRPGGYGHMSMHSCEVVFDNVTNVERGPPWFFEPPPPNE
jgi:hypothetical protein